MCKYIKKRYWTESTEWRYVKGHGFLSFAKYIGKKISKNFSSKCS